MKVHQLCTKYTKCTEFPESSFMGQNIMESRCSVCFFYLLYNSQFSSFSTPPPSLQLAASQRKGYVRSSVLLVCCIAGVLRSLRGPRGLEYTTFNGYFIFNFNSKFSNDVYMYIYIYFQMMYICIYVYMYIFSNDVYM